MKLINLFKKNRYLYPFFCYYKAIKVTGIRPSLWKKQGGDNLLL